MAKVVTNQIKRPRQMSGRQRGKDIRRGTELPTEL